MQQPGENAIDTAQSQPGVFHSRCTSTLITLLSAGTNYVNATYMAGVRADKKKLVGFGSTK